MAAAILVCSIDCYDNRRITRQGQANLAAQIRSPWCLRQSSASQPQLSRLLYQNRAHCRSVQQRGTATPLFRADHILQYRQSSVNLSSKMVQHCGATAVTARHSRCLPCVRILLQRGIRPNPIYITLRPCLRRPPPPRRRRADTRPAAARCTCRAAGAPAAGRPRGRSPGTAGTRMGAGTHRCRAPTPKLPAPEMHESGVRF
jgi:hypothetical protein